MKCRAQREKDKGVERHLQKAVTRFYQSASSFGMRVGAAAGGGEVILSFGEDPVISSSSTGRSQSAQGLPAPGTTGIICVCSGSGILLRPYLASGLSPKRISSLLLSVSGKAPGDNAAITDMRRGMVTVGLLCIQH